MTQIHPWVSTLNHDYQVHGQPGSWFWVFDVLGIHGGVGFVGQQKKGKTEEQWLSMMVSWTWRRVGSQTLVISYHAWWWWWKITNSLINHYILDGWVWLLLISLPVDLNLERLIIILSRSPPNPFGFAYEMNIILNGRVDDISFQNVP